MPANGSCSPQKQGECTCMDAAERQSPIKPFVLTVSGYPLVWADSHMSALMRHQLAVPVPLPREQPLLVVGAGGGPAFVCITSPPSFPTTAILPTPIRG
ncbi:hypothetical protein SLE2022_101990 [Rubroshorea leprosula]